MLLNVSYVICTDIVPCFLYRSGCNEVLVSFWKGYGFVVGLFVGWFFLRCFLLKCMDLNWVQIDYFPTLILSQGGFRLCRQMGRRPLYGSEVCEKKGDADTIKCTVRYVDNVTNSL